VGGVAQEGDARDSVLAVANRQGIDWAKDGGGFPVGDECGEFGSPSGELLRDQGRRRGGAGGVDVGDPLLRLGQRDVRVKDAVGLSVREEPLARRDGEQGTAADCRGRRGVDARRSMDVSCFVACWSRMSWPRRTWVPPGHRCDRGRHALPLMGRHGP